MCSVTQIMEGGRWERWELARGRLGAFHKNPAMDLNAAAAAAAGTKWLIRQKRIGSARAWERERERERVLFCTEQSVFSGERGNLSTIVGRTSRPISFSLLNLTLINWLYPKSAILLNFSWFFGFSQLFLGQTASGSQSARGHELFTYSHRTSGPAPAAVPCPCRSASTGPEREIFICIHLFCPEYYLWIRAIRKWVSWQHVQTSHVRLHWNSPAVQIRWLMNCNRCF